MVRATTLIRHRDGRSGAVLHKNQASRLATTLFRGYLKSTYMDDFASLARLGRRFGRATRNRRLIQ